MGFDINKGNDMLLSKILIDPDEISDELDEKDSITQRQTKQLDVHDT